MTEMSNDRQELLELLLAEEAEETGEPEVFPLSPQQRGMWLAIQLDPGAAAYVIANGLRLSGRLDREALRQSIGEVVRRHEALRIRFAAAGGEPVQIPDPEVEVPLPFSDLSGLSDPGRATELRRLNDELRQPFDLAHTPLLRVRLVRLSEEEHAVLFALHHLVSDGWSVGILIREVAALYGAFSQGRPSPLPELPIQYLDYVEWQREWLSGGVLDEQLAWWKERLAGAPALELPTDRRRPNLPSLRGASRLMEPPPVSGAAFRAFCLRHGATPFMVLLAAFQALLLRWSGQDDFVVGTAVANRRRSEVEDLIGLFVNTLALRADIAGDPTFAELVARVKAGMVEAYARQDLPFERLIAETGRAGAQPFQVFFQVQNAPFSALELPGLTLTPMPRERETAEFDLLVNMADSPEGITGEWIYGTDLFDAATVARLSAQLGQLLAVALAGEDQRISELPLGTPAEVHQAVSEWNDSGDASPAPEPLALFEAAAAARPDAPVVVWDGGRLTYGELDRRANAVARRLRSLGIGPEVPVGVVVPRSAELLLAAVAIAKAGGVYLPLDPAYPDERIAGVLDDAGARVVLTISSLADRLGGRALIELDGIGDEAGDPVEPLGGPENLAYLIFTSGSTGRPKGVAVERRSFANFMAWYVQALGTGPEDRLSMVLGPAFDASLLEVWGPLVAGASVYIPDDEVRVSPPLLADWVARSEITRLTLPAPLANALLAGPLPELPALRNLYAGGDQLARIPAGLGFTVTNLYGPSETTVVSNWEADAMRGTDRGPDVGRPVRNARVYVLDERLGLLPVGAVGEAFLGGEILARGYLGRPDLTAEVYLPDPFGLAPGARMYRTGDRARLLADGRLDVLGRRDGQVKIRGFRVELGEIEAVMRAHPGVRQTVVTAYGEGGDRRLAGYVVGEASDDELRVWLRARLPEYMVPTLVLLDALPLTPNGKVDVRALPVPGREERAGYLPPRNEAEEALARIWAGLLGMERVGAHDNFFELGGHSLMATRVTAALRETFGVELPLRVLFEKPTLAELAAEVATARAGAAGAEAERIPRQPRQPGEANSFPVSASQLREWILDRLQEGDTAAYNMPGGGRVLGPLDRRVLDLSVQEVVRRHESLRTTFAEGGSAGEPVQVIVPELRIPIPFLDLSGLPAEVREREAGRISRADLLTPFDLARGPLLRVRLMRLAEREHRVLFNLHHIVSDGWSMGVFFREMASLYGAFAAGQPSPLPELPVQYADYAVWQRQRLEGEGLRKQLDHWRGLLAGIPPLELSTDRPRPPMQRFEGAKYQFMLPADLSAGLKDLAHRQGASPFMVLLAAFSGLLTRYTGQEDFGVGTYAGNRNRAELENLIGFFINTLVLRMRPEGGAAFADLVARARDTALAAFANQDVSFEQLLETLNIERDLSRTPLFQVMLVFQNFPAETVQASDVRLEMLTLDNDRSDFDLSLWMSESPAGLGGYFSYATRLFDEATVARLAAHFEILLRGAVAEPGRALRELPLMTEPERRQLLEWSAGPAAPDAATRVERMFAGRARTAPDASALEWEGGGYTYAELESRVDALAGRLRSLGVGPETLVGLSANRSPEMIVALLGVLRAGGAYLPLDPAYPEARLAMMIEDSAVPLLLTQEALASRLPAGDSRVVLLDGAEEPAPAVDLPDGDLQDPAYVIYTSGSTGRPKGVVVEHRSLASYVTGAVEAFELRPGDRVLQFASISFDTSGEEIYPALASGATLVLRPEEMAASIAHFLREVERLRITVLDLPTAFWHELVAGLGTEGELPACVRLVVLGGERALPDRLALWRQRVGPGVRLLNTYGPTEATIVSTRRDLTTDADEAPIGTPIPGARAHVLDRWGAPVPVGVGGELHVGGAGLARGYLRRPEVTAERFVPDPFGPAGERLYRTGDLVRWRPSGDLEFLGRVDHQIKIRGFRVELGEIEAALRSHPGVHDAAVVLGQGPGGDARLVGYLVRAGEGGDAIPPAELRGFLQERLPEYMVPALFMELPALPLTPSGKVDRRALPAPEARRDASVQYVAPRSEIERSIAAVWCELLGVERIGLDDNFFDLGAHSLLLVRAHARLRETLGRELTVVDLFRHPTVGALARHLSRGEEKPKFQEVKSMAQQQKAAQSRQRQAMEKLRKGPNKR